VELGLHPVYAVVETLPKLTRFDVVDKCECEFKPVNGTTLSKDREGYSVRLDCTVNIGLWVFLQDKSEDVCTIRGEQWRRVPVFGAIIFPRTYGCP